MTAASDGDRLTRYLLGELPPEEAEALENDCFEDDEAQAALEAADDELVDAFVRGTLSPERRRAAESRYAASLPWRDKVRFSRALLRRADAGAASRPAASSRRTIAWAVAAGLAAAVVTWIVADLRSARRQPDAVRIADARVVSFDLNEGSTRDLFGTVLQLPSDAGVVRLHLHRDGPPPPPPLTATIRTADGTEVWSARGLGVRSDARETVVTLQVGAEHLPPGDYVATLSREGDGGGRQELASYAFRTER